MGGANLDKGLDGSFGNVQERRSASHVSPLAHGRRGVNEKYYDGHASKKNRVEKMIFGERRLINVREKTRGNARSR